MNWTQPMCEACWVAFNPELRPARIINPQVELCAWCGEYTTDGIYMHANPDDVPYPAVPRVTYFTRRTLDKQ